jgi:hypothetical protein
MPVPIPPTPVENPSRFYYALEDNSAAAFAGPTGLAADNVFVNLDGVSIPKDHPHYPWRFDAAEGVVFTGSNDTNDPPPLNGNLEVGRNTSLNFNKIGFPQGYHTDAKVLNRVFTDGLLQSNELVDSADIADTAWANASAVPAPNEAQANDYFMMSDFESEWQIRNAAWTKDKLLLDTDDDVRFTQCSSTDLSCILATDLAGGLPNITNNFWTPGTIYFSAVDPGGQPAYGAGGGEGVIGYLDWNRALATDTEVELTKDGSTLILSSTSAVDFLSYSMANINRAFGPFDWPQNFDYWSDFRADASGNLRMIDKNFGAMGIGSDGGRYPPVMTPSGNIILSNIASHWNTVNSTITARGNLSFPFYFHSAAYQNDGDSVTLLRRAGGRFIKSITVVRDGIFDKFKITFWDDWTTDTFPSLPTPIASVFTLGATGHNLTGGGDDKPITFASLDKVILSVYPYFEKDAIYINPMSDADGITPVHKSDAVTVRGWIHFHEDLI